MKSRRRAVFAPPNYLLYTRDGTLYAQRLDVKTLLLQSEPVRAAENVGEADKKGGGSSFAVSDNGVLAYREKLAPVTHQLAWYGRRGNRLKPVGPPGGFTYISLSPDEKYVAATGLSEGRKTSCLWLLSVKSGGIQCITPEAKGLAAIPAWSADSKSIAVALDGVPIPSMSRQELHRCFPKMSTTIPTIGHRMASTLSATRAGAQTQPPLVGRRSKSDQPACSPVAVRGFRYFPGRQMGGLFHE